MSDILAGGSIDPTTSGPTPPNNDPRPQDVVSDQKARQEQNAVGGTQQPPRVEPPIEVPNTISIAAPPLPTLEEPSFLSFGQSSMDATREVARQAVVDVLKNVTIDGRGPSIEGSAISFDTERRSVSSQDFGTGGNKDFISSGYSQLSDYPSLGGTVRQEPQRQSRLDSADFGTKEGMEDRSSAESYKAAEERRQERRRSDPSFDEDSRLRQRGESQTEFKERQEKLQAERAEAEKREEQIQQLKSGDTTVLPSGMVPVALTRADGQEKILAYVSTEFVGVVDGVEGERTVTLPSEDNYYEAGGGAAPCSLGLYTKDGGVWVSAGTVAGQLPSGFNPMDGKNIANGGSGNVWAEVNIDQETGEITSVAVTGGSSTPQNTNTSFYYTIGYYQYSGTPPSPKVSNYSCGNINATICRRWFASDPPFYGVTLSSG